MRSGAVPKGLKMSAANISLDRMMDAVENHRRRLLRATAALGNAGLMYAVVGGNAVAAWVSSVDPGQVRNTIDVDVLIRRVDLGAARSALEAAGFVHWNGPGFDVFRDGLDGRPSEGVHILFSGEKVWPDDLTALPDVMDSEHSPHFRVVSLRALVINKLTVFRRKDQVHILDLIRVRLVDASWLPGLPAPLAARLKELLDDPNG